MQAKLGYHLGYGHGKRTVDRAAAGAGVPATAEVLGDAGDIQGPFAAQARAEAAIRQFPEEDGNFDVLDRECVVDQTLAVFFFGADRIHLLVSDPDPGKRTFAVKVGEGRAEKAHLGGGVAEVYIPRATCRISTCQNELP